MRSALTRLCALRAGFVRLEIPHTYVGWCPAPPHAPPSTVFALFGNGQHIPGPHLVSHDRRGLAAWMLRVALRVASSGRHGGGPGLATASLRL